MEFKAINPIVFGKKYGVTRLSLGQIQLKLGSLAQHLNGPPNDIELSEYSINLEKYHQLSNEQKSEQITQSRLEFDTSHPNDLDLFAKMFPQAYELAFQTPIAHTIEICQQRLHLPYFKESLTNLSGYTLKDIANLCYHCYVNQRNYYFPEENMIPMELIGIILYSTDLGKLTVEIIHDCESDQ
jgi:hypothetical protein